MPRSHVAHQVRWFPVIYALFVHVCYDENDDKRYHETSPKSMAIQQIHPANTSLARKTLSHNYKSSLFGLHGSDSAFEKYKIGQESD
eukprot:6169085-Amphidinium_carterae.1